MKGKFKNFLFEISEWLKNTPERAVDIAYKSAVTIKKLEDDYFEGKPMSKDWGYADNTYSLFKTQLQNALVTIDIRLAEYKISSRIPNLLKTDVPRVPIKLIGNPNLDHTNPNILQKLAFIDFILSRYRSTEEIIINESNHPVPLIDAAKMAPKARKKLSKPVKPSLIGTETVKNEEDHGVFTPKYVEQTYVPISILQSLERIRRNITSGDSYEQDLVQEARQTRRRINIAIRFLVILVVVTLSTQQISKNFIYKPLVEYWEERHKVDFNFTEEIQERALHEFRAEKEKLEFQFLLSKRSDAISLVPNEAEAEKQLQEKVLEIYEHYQDLSLEGIQNLCADVTAVCVLYGILIISKKEIGIIKQFLDETLHGLNDNAKAFLIIVTTDTFVGYHSSDGWEVLIDTVSIHFGLPENRDFTLAFIAIVPVFLDALLKFWVFQALTQSSPSTAAIYGEMNK